MTDLFRKQLLRARKKLDDPNCEVETKWLERLLGSGTVEAVTADIEQRVRSKARQLGMIPPQPPGPFNLDLSEEGLEYWNEVLRLKDIEPPPPRVFWRSQTAKPRKQKFKMPRRLLLLSGGLVGFSPKLNKRELFIERVTRHAHKFDDLPAAERAKFTTDYGLEMGGLRLPHPKGFADEERYRAKKRDFYARTDKLRREATLDAWRAALDKALGWGTGTYKLAGRVVGIETQTEKEGQEE